LSDDDAIQDEYIRISNFLKNLLEDSSEVSDYKILEIILTSGEFFDDEKFQSLKDSIQYDIHRLHSRLISFESEKNEAIEARKKMFRSSTYEKTSKC